MKRLGNRRKPGKSLADLLAVVVLIPLVGVLVAGCVNRRRDGYSRVKCSANLKSIGQAILLYAGENKQNYPRGLYQPGATVIPTWGTGATATNAFASNGPGPNDVTAAIYLLLATQDISSEVFTCPSANYEKWDFDGGGNTVANWSNWNGVEGVRKHLAYSMQNPYGDDQAVASGFKLNTSLSAEYAVAADINPGKSGSIEDVLAVNATSTLAQIKRGNSPNHGNEGQNILWGDGHVDFQLTPMAGIGGDNIYARSAGTQNRESTSVINSSYDKNDNVLLPTDD